MADFFQIPPQNVGDAWPVVRPYMLSAVERSSGKMTELTVFDCLTSGKWQLWVYWDKDECLAGCVTRLNLQSSGTKTLEVIIASGVEREKWQRIAVDTWKSFAKAEGCNLLELIARPGWERVFPEFRKTHVMLEMRIE